jgi:bifunctional glutamyl/prolyl-tRNA synthetase
MASNENLDVESLKARIDEQANLVRKLKSTPNPNKVRYENSLNNLFSIFLSKDEVTAAVQQLLKLKEEYKTLTGQDVPSSGAAPVRKEKEKKPAAAAAATKKNENEQASAGTGATDSKKQTKSVLKQKKLIISK